MDHQGASRTRRAADTRRQPPWPAADGPGYPEGSAFPGGSGLPGGEPGFPGDAGAQRVPGAGTGPQRLTGPQQVTGPQGLTGPQHVTGPQGLTGSGGGARAGLAAGTGAHRVLGPGTGPNRLLGPYSGAQPTLGPAGPPDAAGRTPTSGFPSAREPAESPTGSFGPWHTPTGPLPVQDDTEDAYPPNDPGFSGQLPADSQAPSGGRRRGSGGGRTRRRTLAWIAVAAVVAAGAGFAGFKYLYEARVNAPVPPTLRLPTNAPGSPGFDKALGKWQHIGTRARDPQALTIAGLYPPQFSLDGKGYTRTAASATKTCSVAVYGTDLQAALQAGHCSQVVRASYISGDGTMMGTVGVINLISSNAAQKAGQVTGPEQIIAPLTSKKGPTKKLGTGTGVVQAEIKGHYLILMWAEYANLKSPSGQAQRQALEQFAANLVTGSANINLSTRMLSGKQ
jgi:hypothetical protein